MAAVIELRTGAALSGVPHRTTHFGATPAGPPAHTAQYRPLRVVHGGRSSQVRQLRRVFWLRRALVLGAAILAVWLGVQVVHHALLPISGAAEPAQLGRVHVVEPGDTLWGLATSVDPQADTRDVVDRLLELNAGGPALGADGQLLAGETVRLPVRD